MPVARPELPECEGDEEEPEECVHVVLRGATPAGFIFEEVAKGAALELDKEEGEKGDAGFPKDRVQVSNAPCDEAKGEATYLRRIIHMHPDTLTNRVIPQRDPRHDNRLAEHGLHDHEPMQTRRESSPRKRSRRCRGCRGPWETMCCLSSASCTAGAWGVNQ